MAFSLKMKLVLVDVQLIVSAVLEANSVQLVQQDIQQIMQVYAYHAWVTAEFVLEALKELV